MLLSPEEAEIRLKSSDNLANAVNGKVQNAGEHSTRFSRRETIIGSISLRPFWNGGRREGDTNVPSFIREIAATAAQLEPSANVAKNLGLSKSQVDQYKAGCVSPGVENPDLVSAIDKNLGEVRELAVSKMMASMNLIDEDKLKKCKATELANVAASLSKVATSAEKKKEAGGDRIIVFSPESKEENHYTTIVVHQ